MDRKSMLLVKGFGAQLKTQEQPLERNRIEVLIETILALLEEVKALRAAPSPEIKDGLNFYREVEAFEVCLIQRALEATNGNQAQAARLLGLRLTTLNTMIKRYKISISVHAESHAGLESLVSQK